MLYGYAEDLGAEEDLVALVPDGLADNLQVKYVLLLSFQALVFCRQTAAEGVGADSTAARSFRQQVLSGLGEQLLQPEPLRTRAFNRYLMKQTGVGGSDVRKGMLALLDSLEAERKGKSEKWQRIRTSGGTHVKPRQVDKLLKELTKRTRKVLENNEDETLGSLLQHGAKKADVPDYRARAVLLRALEVPTDSAAVFLGFPAKVTILLEMTTLEMTRGMTTSGYLSQRLFPVSDDLLNEVKRDILPSLERRLKESESVVSDSIASTKSMKPDCRLVFEIRKFGRISRPWIPEPRETEVGSFTPAPFFGVWFYMEAQLTIEDIATGIEVHRDEIVIQSLYGVGEAYLVEDIHPAQALIGKFYQEAALAVSEIVDAYLAK